MDELWEISHPVEAMLAKGIKSLLIMMQENTNNLTQDYVSSHGGIDRFLSIPYAFVQKVVEVATGPVGLAVLGVCIMLSLYETFTKNSELKSGDKIFETIVLQLLSFVGLKVIMENSTSVLLYIDYLAKSLAGQISNINLGEVELISVSYMGEAEINTMIDIIRLEGALMPFLMLALIALLCTQVAVIASRIVIMATYLEMLLYMAISPIPLAMLAHDQTREMGKGFLINYTSTAFQITMLVLLMKLYPLMMSQIIVNMMPSPDIGSVVSTSSSFNFIAQPLVYSIVFMLGVLGIAGLTRKIFGRG